MQPEDYNGIYAELLPLLGEESVQRLFYYYRGQQVTFPNQLYSLQYIQRYLEVNYNGRNYRQLLKNLAIGNDG